jgi:small subunit ribosomal protein S17
MDKTIVVAVIDNVKHPLIGKIVKKTYKLYAEDAENTCNVGDTVRVMETRPLSKMKRWRLVEAIRLIEVAVLFPFGIMPQHHFHRGVTAAPLLALINKCAHT